MSFQVSSVPQAVWAHTGAGTGARALCAGAWAPSGYSVDMADVEYRSRWCTAQHSTACGGARGCAVKAYVPGTTVPRWHWAGLYFCRHRHVAARARSGTFLLMRTPARFLGFYRWLGVGLSRGSGVSVGLPDVVFLVWIPVAWAAVAQVG